MQAQSMKCGEFMEQVQLCSIPASNIQHCVRTFWQVNWDEGKVDKDKLRREVEYAKSMRNPATAFRAALDAARIESSFNGVEYQRPKGLGDVRIPPVFLQVKAFHSDRLKSRSLFNRHEHLCPYRHQPSASISPSPPESPVLF